MEKFWLYPLFLLAFFQTFKTNFFTTKFHANLKKYLKFRSIFQLKKPTVPRSFIPRIHTSKSKNVPTMNQLREGEQKRKRNQVQAFPSPFFVFNRQSVRLKRKRNRFLSDVFFARFASHSKRERDMRMSSCELVSFSICEY
jgi:hypothetical protein